MKKIYSKKERQARKFVRNVIISFLVIVIMIILFVVINNSIAGERVYTAEEMLHDHDGDGIPDHWLKDKWFVLDTVLVCDFTLNGVLIKKSYLRIIKQGNYNKCNYLVGYIFSIIYIVKDIYRN